MIKLELRTDDNELPATLRSLMFEYNVRGHLELEGNKIVFVVDEIVSKQVVD